jgi:hypothetical protein
MAFMVSKRIEKIKDMFPSFIDEEIDPFFIFKYPSGAFCY